MNRSRGVLKCGTEESGTGTGKWRLRKEQERKAISLWDPSIVATSPGLQDLPGPGSRTLHQCERSPYRSEASTPSMFHFKGKTCLVTTLFILDAYFYQKSQTPYMYMFSLPVMCSPFQLISIIIPLHACRLFMGDATIWSAKPNQTMVLVSRGGCTQLLPVGSLCYLHRQLTPPLCLLNIHTAIFFFRRKCLSAIPALSRRR